MVLVHHILIQSGLHTVPFPNLHLLTTAALVGKNLDSAVHGVVGYVMLSPTFT
jgi:hypothetical protein